MVTLKMGFFMKRILASWPARATIAILFTASPSYSQNNIIFGCITKTSGQIRVVSTAGKCKSNETLLSWNQAGVEGPRGPAGPQGTAGVPLGVCSDSDTKSYILYPFLTNQTGFDTGFSIANTTSDPFGTTGTAGTCTLNFFGASAPSALTTASIVPGGMYVNLASTIAPGFQGYMIASCDFPLAHAFAFISDLGARNLAMGYLPSNICSPRIAPQ